MKILLFLSTFLFGTASIFCQTNPYNVDALTKTATKKDTLHKSEITKKMPYINPVDWQKGMRFMVEPIRHESLRNLMKLDLAPYKSEKHYLHKIKQNDFEWKEFTYQGLEVRSVKCPKGKCLRTYLIFDCESKQYQYEYIGDTTSFRNAKVLSGVTNLVYLNEIDTAKKYLLGKTFYTKTHQLLIADKDGIGRYNKDNPKYIPVEITSIGLGTQVSPCKIIFKLNGSDSLAYLNVSFSGINAGTRPNRKSFDKFFQLDNPKNEYPKISADIWSNIQKGEVSIGMNKKECELSWGKPNDINKTLSSHETSEQWVYSSTSYLYFKSGILETIQY